MYPTVLPTVPIMTQKKKKKNNEAMLEIALVDVRKIQFLRINPLGLIMLITPLN